MTIFWPSELQQKPQVKGFQVTLADNAVRSPVDAGSLEPGVLTFSIKPLNQVNCFVEDSGV